MPRVNRLVWQASVWLSRCRNIARYAIAAPLHFYRNDDCAGPGMLCEKCSVGRGLGDRFDRARDAGGRATLPESPRTPNAPS